MLRAAPLTNGGTCKLLANPDPDREPVYSADTGSDLLTDSNADHIGSNLTPNPGPNSIANTVTIPGPNVEPNPGPDRLPDLSSDSVTDTGADDRANASPDHVPNGIAIDVFAV